MSEKKRKVFGPQQKAKVALEAIRGSKTVNEIAQQFGVHPTQVSQWKKELLEQAPELFEGKRGPKLATDTEAASDRLYSEIGRLKMGSSSHGIHFMAVVEWWFISVTRDTTSIAKKFNG